MVVDGQSVDQIVSTIRTLHQTTIDQRPHDLSEYLTEVFQFIREQHQIHLFNSLKILLCEYEDRAALKIEFIKAQCLETIHQILNDEINNEENITGILGFIFELLVNSENVQKKFLDFDGYEKIFQFLYHVHSPSIDFINQVLILMTEKPTLQVDHSLPPMDLFIHFMNPHIAVIVIRWIPYLTDASHQHHIIHSINVIVSRSLQNKAMACSNDIIYSLVDILYLKQFEDKILLDNIFSILEKLSRFSINEKEIRHIFQLFDKTSAFKKQLLRVLITAAKHDDPDTDKISSCFDLQRSNSGIILPPIRRWPSMYSALLHCSFHCWLRLNTEIESYPYDARRQVYSFYSDSIGLESFIYGSSLYVLVHDRREPQYIEIAECDDLVDGCWHSLTIVHTAQRPSLLVAAFQTASTCHLTVYIDGVLRKQVKDFKYVPLMNDPIASASVGAPSQRPRSSTFPKGKDSLIRNDMLAKTLQPLTGLFTFRPKAVAATTENQMAHLQNSLTLPLNSPDALLKESTSLHGQIACVWVLAETLNEVQVKHLHSMGANFCHQIHPLAPGDTSLSSTIYDLLSNRSVLIYHPLACNGQICIDISACTSQMNGRLNNGHCLRVRSFSESLLNLGGCSILYPLFEKFQESDYYDAAHSETMASSSSGETPTDWIIVRKQSQKNSSDIDNRLISNPIASAVNLIRCVLSSTSMTVLSEQMTKHRNVDVLGKHLHLVPACFIDQQFLIAIQQLIECSRLNESSNLLTNQLIQYILLDFGLWNKAKYNVRMSHLQYITSVIKDERKYYRNKFGVQYFLDIIRQYFVSSEEDTTEQKQLRSAVYGIIKYYVQRRIRIEELNAILSSIATVSMFNDSVTQEQLEFILALLDPPTVSTDSTIGLLCEPNMTEGLFTLLTVNTLSSRTKELVLKIVKCLIVSRRVPQQVRTQLRLETNGIGFGGIISDLTSKELSVTIVREIFNLINNSDSSIDVDQLNIVLTLCSEASLDVRYVAMRKLMSCFIATPSVCRSYAKCHGWQETLAHFFVKERRTVTSTDGRSAFAKQDSVDPDKGSSFYVNLSSTQSPIFEPTIQSGNSIHGGLTEQLDVSQTLIDESGSMRSTKSISSPRPSVESTTAFRSTSPTIDGKEPTPEFIERSGEFQQNITETVATSLKSSSNSREDLLSLMRTECSEEDLTSTASSNDVLNPLPRTITTTSIKHLYSDEENNEKAGRLGPEVRLILGSLIGLLFDRNDDSARAFSGYATVTHDSFL